MDNACYKNGLEVCASKKKIIAIVLLIIFSRMHSALAEFYQTPLFRLKTVSSPCSKSPLHSDSQESLQRGLFRSCLIYNFNGSEERT